LIFINFTTRDSGNNRPMRPRIFAFAAIMLSAGLFAASAQGAEPDARYLHGRHQAAGVKCASCHIETLPSAEPSSAKCLECHGPQEKLAGVTSLLMPNPHASPHLQPGQAVVCTECHHVHKQAEVTCLKCHQTFKFNVK
jgi:hypothetical protein